MAKSITGIVIDDDLDTVAVFTEYLNLKGIEVVGMGYNGKDAVNLYKSLKPDFVFLDIMMPDFDGLYAIEKIFEYDLNAKIIVVTADVSSDTKEKISKTKVSGVLFKPYEMDNIMELLDNLSKNYVVSSSTMN